MFPLKLGSRRYQMLTTGSACAFPDENDYPARFPIAAILPQIKDMYEPSPGTWPCAELDDWQSWRRKSSRSLEQIALLMAMAQHQAQVLSVSGSQNEDSRLNIFEVCLLPTAIVHSLANHFKPFLLVPNDTKVQIIRARVPRQVLDALDRPNWSQLFQELPQDIYIRIEQSVPLDTLEDNGSLKLLSAMEAMLRRYDEMKPLFARPPAPQEQAVQHEEKHASSPVRPGPDHELGSSPERGRVRTRRGLPTRLRQALSAEQKLPSGSSEDGSTQPSTASSQEQGSPHAIRAVHGPTRRGGARHMEAKCSS